MPVRSFASEVPAMGAISDEQQGPDLREWVKARGGESKTVPRMEKLKREPNPPPAQFQSKWVWIPLSFVFLILGVVVGFQSALMLNRNELQRAATNTVALELSAKTENGKIVVRWDRSSSAIHDAASGSLRIMDGEFSKMVNLDSRQLQNGSVIYMSAENKVSFRLEVTTRQKTTISETVEFVPVKP